MYTYLGHTYNGTRSVPTTERDYQLMMRTLKPEWNTRVREKPIKESKI